MPVGAITDTSISCSRVDSPLREQQQACDQQDRAGDQEDLVPSTLMGQQRRVSSRKHGCEARTARSDHS